MGPAVTGSSRLPLLTPAEAELLAAETVRLDLQKQFLAIAERLRAAFDRERCARAGVLDEQCRRMPRAS
jgi:hypothetical protein